MIYKTIYRTDNGKILTTLGDNQSLNLILDNFKDLPVDVIDIEFEGTPFELSHHKLNIETMQLVSIFQ